VLADKLLKGGKGFKEAREQVAQGDKQVAKGEDKVSIGERDLDAGKLELREGREQLKLARGIRVACAFGGAIFASLLIVLGFRWKRFLTRIFMDMKEAVKKEVKEQVAETKESAKEVKKAVQGEAKK
jgi:hypothetical protein